MVANQPKLPTHYIVVDLGSGSFLKNNIGHEVFNLTPNEIDGLFYGYIPPYDNPDITQLGASITDEYIDGVMVVYVEKMANSSNRKIIAFTDNARVYAKEQSGASLNRFIFDKGKRIECSYTVMSEYIYDLRSVSNPFIFEVKDEDLYMFRKQRFYAGRRPKQEKKMLKWLSDYLQKRNLEEYDDLGFQFQIQNADDNRECSEASKQEPSYNDGTSGKTVAKKAYVSKQALKEAKYKCMFDNRHNTFKTNKGVQYMEGHHLIPCTATNSEYFWHKYKRNIDCAENIVCLCPTCHRQIHFGNKEEREVIITYLYKKMITSLKTAGIDISQEDLLQLYN